MVPKRHDMLLERHGGRYFGRYGRGAIAALLIGAVMALPGCRQDEEDDSLPPSSEAAQTQQADPGAQGSAWLELDDGEDPADFLARVTGATPADIEPRLTALNGQYRESARMVANRIAQLWTEVHANDPDLPLTRLLDDLSRPDAARDSESFGPIVQQYLVQRRAGVDHAGAARAALSGTPDSATEQPGTRE